MIRKHPDFDINPPPTGRPVRIYCDGIYDLFHFGHAKALEQAKKSFSEVHLIVGVCDDAVTHEKKGKTVLDESERAESLRHCRWVDEVVEHAPWTVDQAFLDTHQIDYVAHDDIPYQSQDQEDVYAFVKRQGKFLPTQRTSGISTSDIITRIVRDYDAYLRRNLERGVSARELNISFLKESEIVVKSSVSTIGRSIRQNWRGTKDELSEEFNGLRQDVKQTFRVWENRSHEWIMEFAQLFGAQAMVQKILSFRNTPVTTDEDTDSEDGKAQSV